MKEALKIILMMLPYMLDWVDSYIKERKRKQRQEARDALHANPGAWTADHFGGELYKLDDNKRLPGGTSKADD